MIGKTNGNLYAKDGGVEYEQLVNYTILYDNGYVDGIGWNLGYTAGKVTDNGTYIHLNTDTGNSLVRSWMATKTSYDLTPYTKIYAKVNSVAWKSGYFNDLTLTTSTATSGYQSSSPAVEISNRLPAAGEQIHSLDVSSNTTSRYILYIVDYRNTVNIYNVWMCKKDNWEAFAELTGVSADSIETLLESSETLLNNKNAVNFMLKQCTGDFMVTAIQNETFLTALENSPYKTIIQANEHWNKFLNMVA